MAKQNRIYMAFPTKTVYKYNIDADILAVSSNMVTKYNNNSNTVLLAQQ